MKRIFRSIINIKKDTFPTIPYDELVRNYKYFLASKVVPDRDTSDSVVYTWLEAHYREFKEMPSYELLYQKAQSEGNESVLASLKEIYTQPPFIRSDYRVILKTKLEEQTKEKFREIVQTTYQVANDGIKVKKKGKERELKGLTAAIDYFVSKARECKSELTGVKTESDIRSEEDCKEVIEEYRKRKRNPLANLGMFSYLERIDDSFKGIKPGELFIIAAFVAQGKSTLSTNIAYNALVQGLNGVFFSLEMTHDEMRDFFYVLHCSYPEWYSHPKYKKLAGKISYEKVRYGELSEEEQEFFEEASRDFESREDFGRLMLYQPSGYLTPSGLEMNLQDFKGQMDEKGRTLDFCLVDYIGLMVQDQENKYGDFNIDLNNIIKRLKNYALTFDNGKGIRMITPFQVNREGWKDATKNEGVYKLTALSNANEAERGADGVIALFMDDEMKKNGQMKISCLKNRKGAVFSPFEVYVDFQSKRIRDIIQPKTSGATDDSMTIEIIGESIEKSG